MNILKVFGGGLLRSTNLQIDANEVIVDKKGTISVSREGYSANGKNFGTVIQVSKLPGLGKSRHVGKE